MFSLATDGDYFECRYWALFIRDQFPSYEKFWLRFVVPLTNRPKDIHFKTDSELSAVGKTASDVHTAQLNYSVLKHLARCFDVLRLLKDSVGMEQQDLLLEGIVRLVGAQDNAFELLERFNNPQKNYTAFNENASEQARRAWIRSSSNRLKPIRDYRNNIAHGLQFPSIADGKRLCYPEIGKEGKYFDWRLITASSPSLEQYKKDFISVLTILEGAWNETLGYLEGHWKNL
jgi:hypothetical protein